MHFARPSEDVYTSSVFQSNIRPSMKDPTTQSHSPSKGLRFVITAFGFEVNA